MKTATAERCVNEINRFLKAWADCQNKYAESIPRLTQIYGKDSVERSNKDFLNSGHIGREHAALRRASLDLTRALADLRQGR